MAIEIVDGASVNFGEVAGVNNATLFTFHCTTKLTGANAVGYPHRLFEISDNTFVTGDIEIGLAVDETYNHLSFLVEWDKGTYPVYRGLWRSSGITFEIGPVYTIDITYDMSSASNDPKMYVNGSEISITEILTPVAPSPDLSDDSLYFGIPYSGYGQFIVYDGKIYNRILSAAEILEIYTSKGASYPRNGLVFCPYMIGAKGLQAFHNTVLAAGNTIVDPCSGAVGVPSGSPIGIGETYLRIR